MLETRFDVNVICISDSINRIPSCFSASKLRRKLVCFEDIRSSWNITHTFRSFTRNNFSICMSSLKRYQLILTTIQRKRQPNLKMKNRLPSKSASWEPFLWITQLFHISGLSEFLKLSVPNWDLCWSSLTWKPPRGPPLGFNEEDLLSFSRLAVTFTT